MFGRLVVAYRRRLGLTQEELAARTGLSVRAIRNMESGQVRVPRPGSVRLLADAFGLQGSERERFRSGANTEADGAAASVPAQLPLDVPDFTGRAGELAWLDSLLPAEGPEPSTVLVVAVAGTAGVGKTALAVHWAQRIRARFPDGQLYVNLRGYDPRRPAAAADVLSRFLNDLGVAEQDIPVDVEDRGARFRTEVAGRRMLLVLDNAESVEQVRPLLPGTPSCMALVTSRDSLAGLVALDGARPHDLDPLPAAEAITLLRRLIGARVDAEPATVAVLAAQCVQLPLALRIAAALANARPAIALADLAEELADRQRRVDLLDVGDDPRAAVRTVLSWSYDRLPTGAARAFRLLGLHPGPDLDAFAAAALTGDSLDHIRRLLGLLGRAHLIQRTGAGRYGMHDLLHAYAAQVAATEESEADREAALSRLFDYYAATAAEATGILYPAEQDRRAPAWAADPDLCTPQLPDPGAALAWLNAELPNLVAITTRAAGGSPAHAIRLAADLFRYLEGGHYHDAQQALALCQQIGNRYGEARALNNLGTVHWQLGRYEAAADHYRRALTLWRHTRDRYREAYALDNLGVVYWRLGEHDKAASYERRALTIFRELGDRTGQAHALADLGKVYLQQGRHEAAAEHLQRALALHRELGDRKGQAASHNILGTLHLRRRQHGPAADHLHRALDLFREIGDRNGEVSALNEIGESLHTVGRPADARHHHTTALEIAAEIGEQHGQARAHAGIARANHSAGDLAQAARHWQHALTLYADLGVPDADDARAQLDRIRPNNR